MTTTTIYRPATAEDIDFFRTHGYIVVRDVIDPAELDRISELCDKIIERKETLAFDWAWEKDKTRDERDFKILQSSPTMLWPDAVGDAPFRKWAVEFGSALMGFPLEFWYDQFLAKPPQKGVATLWHQDEGYWGRNLDDLGVTCWMPFHDVDERNGCMHFIDGGQQDGVLPHRQPENVQSDLLFCEPDESRAVACPISRGSVTFHHSKTPHMTTANSTDAWRRILTQHLRKAGAPGEGDHYPWKANGNSANPEWPNLAGQHEQYIHKQLQAFKSGARKNPLMTPMAMSLSDDDMEDLGAYFSSQKPAGLEADPGKLTLGQRIFRSGDPKSGVPACASCHGPDGAGNPAAAYPLLRSQYGTYVAAQLRAYRAGTRQTDQNKMMRDVASTMSDEQIDAVASYVQGLR